MSSGPIETSAAAVAQPGRDRLPPALWLGVGLVTGLAVWGFVTATRPPGPDVLPTVNRWLVRVGLPLFVLVLATSPLARLWPSPLARRLLRERRGIGLAWAMIHLTHAAAIMRMWGGDADTVPPTFVIAFGGTGFALTAAMAATSSDVAQRALGRGWGRLHRTGLWYLTFIYAYSYLGDAIATGSTWKWTASAGLLGLVALRFVVWARGRAGAAAPRSAPAAHG